MAETINIGAIGLGAFMARQHLPNLKNHSKARIHTICDLNRELLERRAVEFKPEVCTEHAEEVFKNRDVDAVVVGTRGAAHAVFIEMAAKYNKHIYVEKPMTHTYAETAEVLKILQGSDINVGVGFNRRFAPAMAAAKDMFREYRQGAANIIYRIVDDHRIRPGYIFDMNDGGGHLLAEGCHIFDLLAWFLEEEPVEIYCAGPLETDNMAVIRFRDGSLASLVCGGKGGLFYPKECMEVFCNARTLVVDSFYELRFDGPGGNCIRHFPHSRKRRAFRKESMTEFYRKSFAARPDHDITGAHAANNIPTPSADKGHYQALTAFIDAVAAGKRYSISAVDGARATICALKGYDSIRANRPQKIDPSEYGADAG